MIRFGGLFGKPVGEAPAEDTPVPIPGQGEFGDVAPYYDHLMRAVPYQRWVDYIEAILNRWAMKPAKVLDLCCGTGRAGSEMCRRGYNVLGVDLSEPMVRHCSAQAPALPALVSDAAFLAIKPEQFDLVVSVYDSLNYILDPALLAQCFEDVYRVLEPGGLFIFDVNTPRALTSGLFTQQNLASDDPLLYSWEAHWDPKARVCSVDMWFRWRGNDGATVEFRETHCQYAYRNEEVLKMLEAAGFVGIQPFNAYTFRPVTRWSDRAFYVARKE